MKVTNYPGIYHMVEIDPADWHLLPEVPEGRDSTNINVETEDQLSKYGYIVGKLQRVIFHEPGVKDTNWSTTAPVVGPDGVERRWVYLHYFKQGQPSINWLDPSFAGVRMVIGDALHSLTDLGSGALRLDANGFFKPADQLRAEFDALLAGRDPASVVHHCGSGVSALPNLIAMEIAGLGRTALYAGSWSEWCSDPKRPVAQG